MRGTNEIMLRRDVLAVCRVMALGRSLVVTLPHRFCRREHILKGDLVVMLDRGQKLTAQSFKSYALDERLKAKERGELLEKSMKGV